MQDVLDGKIDGDGDMGRMMDECLGQFSNDDMDLLESLIASNFEDAIMINNLSKLQQHQLRISEQLNSIFATSIKTNNQFSQNKKAKWVLRKSCPCSGILEDNSLERSNGSRELIEHNIKELSLVQL